MSKTVNRGWLLRMALTGRVLLRCRYHYTDDYRADAADNFGTMKSFLPCIIQHQVEYPPEAEGWEREQREWYHRDQMSKWREENKIGYTGHEKVIEYRDSFSGCGRAYTDDGDKMRGTFRVHSNLVYDYIVLPEKAKQEAA